MAFITKDVATNVERGPMPVDRIISSGRITRLMEKTPSGGIQSFRKMAGICMAPSQTYCTDAEQIKVRARLTSGRMK